MLRGIVPMLPTPFGVDGTVALKDLPPLIDAQIASGAHGISLLGLGGEAGFLTLVERQSVAECAIASVNDRVPVVVGVSSGDVSESAVLAAHAAESGATAIMVAPPPSGMDSPDALFEFFQTVANAAANADVMIQDAPQYIGTDVGISVLKRVASEIPNVKYVKTEALPACDAIVQLKQIFDDADIQMFGGQAGINFLDALDAGAVGVIPGCEATRILVEIWGLYETKGDKRQATKLFNAVLPLFVFEMQTLDQFVLCTKRALQQGGLLSTSATRIGSGLSALSERILARHLSALQELEKRTFKNA